ncbi:MAG: APC family permease [bacterium]|jgi:amino acid transporter|nr:APC family permease [bacterium]MDP6244303.1 APC family permease [Myxococcota bacterium]MDP7074699.1 APC family permease [Myxococcota bacterium]MDP7297979.1 APC family permease [Myxococcota bacterium]HJO23057.1 APC family permease [Myxococcota bacterium]
MALRRSIGLMGLTFVAVSGIVGSGWLFAPLLAAQAAGPAAVISWGIGGFAMLLLALCFAEVAALLPVAGGIARIPHFTHGDVTSMLLGWTAWIGYNTAAPIETLAMLNYLGHDFPWLFRGHVGTGPLTPAGAAVAIGVLVLFVVINAIGVRAFAGTNVALTWVKLGIPLILAVVLIGGHLHTENFSEFGGFAPFGVEGVFAAVSSGGVIFALIGFRHAIDMAGEVRRPRVTIPLALILSVLICVGLYAVLQIAFVGAVPPERLVSGWDQLHFGEDLGPIAGVAIAAGLGWATVMLYAGAVVGPLGGGLVSTGSNARLGYALAQNGFFPRWLEKLSARDVPLRSLALNLACGVVILLLVPFEQAVALNGAAITLSFAAGPIAVVALRRQLPDAQRPFRLPMVNVHATIAFVVATLIVYWSGWDTNLRLFVAVLFGAGLFTARFWWGDSSLSEIDLRGALWFVPYTAGLGLLSYAGRFGGGHELLPYPWDEFIVMAFAVGIFALANWCRLSNETAEHYRSCYASELLLDTTPL